MKGTSLSVTWPMRLRPPSSTIAQNAATMMPIMRLAALTLIGVKELMVPEIEVTMELIWVMLPIPKAASIPNSANSVPSQAQFLPRPFLM